MLKHVILLAFLVFAAKAGAQQVRVIKFDAMQQLLQSNNDTTYVVNFWASWCKPCVHELPNYSKIDSLYSGKKVKVILVSLDFVKDVQTKLVPFVKKNHVRPSVWLLNDPDYNSWIDKVDPDWGGSLPATMVFNNSTKIKKFQEKELSYDELYSMVNNVVNKTGN